MNKKTICILAAIIAVTALAGCSPQAESEAPIDLGTMEKEAPASAVPEETAAPAETEPVPAEESVPPEEVNAESPEIDGTVLVGETMFGKVTSVVGNEIELELAKAPFEIGDAGADGGGSSGSYTQSEAKVVTFTEGEDGVQVSEGASSEDAGENSASFYSVIGEDGQVQTFGGDGGEKMELEYTGESKSVLIPAGIDIMSLVGEATIDAVKKGSVLMLTVDESSGTPTATSLTIME